MRLLAIGLLLFGRTLTVHGQTRVELTPPEDKLVEKLVAFEPTKLSVKKVQDHYVLFAAEKELKDFSFDEKAAQQSLRLIRELKVNQYARVADSQPPFEYWLIDGHPVRKEGTLSSFVPFDLNTLTVTKALNVWMLRDRSRMLVSFGNNREAAEEALGVCRKYRFNQIGYVGTELPSMTYLMIDPFQGVSQQSRDPNPLELIQSADRLGLILPEIGLVGPKMQIDARKIEMAQSVDGWQVRYGNEVLGSFAKDDVTARRAMRMLQDFRVTEYVKIGKTGFSLYLSNGQPLVKVPLGYQSVDFKPAELSVKESNGKWFVCRNSAPFMDGCDTKEDATLLLKVMQFYRYDRILVAGNPMLGGMRVMVRDR